MPIAFSFSTDGPDGSPAIHKKIDRIFSNEILVDDDQQVQNVILKHNIHTPCANINPDSMHLKPSVITSSKRGNKESNSFNCQNLTAISIAKVLKMLLITCS